MRWLYKYTVRKPNSQMMESGLVAANSLSEAFFKAKEHGIPVEVVRKNDENGNHMTDAEPVWTPPSPEETIEASVISPGIVDIESEVAIEPDKEGIIDAENHESI